MTREAAKAAAKAVNDAMKRAGEMTGSKRTIVEGALMDIIGAMTTGQIVAAAFVGFTGETLVHALLAMGLGEDEDAALPPLTERMVEAVHRSRQSAMHFMGEVYAEKEDYVPACGHCWYQWCTAPFSAECKERKSDEDDRWYLERW